MAESHLAHGETEATDTGEGLNVGPVDGPGPLRAVEQFSRVNEVNGAKGRRSGGDGIGSYAGEMLGESVWAVTMDDVHEGIPHLSKDLRVGPLARRGHRAAVRVANSGTRASGAVVSTKTSVPLAGGAVHRGTKMF